MIHRLALSFLAATLLTMPLQPPSTRREAVTDTHHGVRVADDYRWLEDAEAPEVREWSDAQNEYARAVLDRLPGVDTIGRRVREILSDESVSYSQVSVGGEKLFALKRQPPKQQHLLVVMDSCDDADSARVLVDPSELDKGGTTRIDWYVPSPDGSLAAVSLSRLGTESGDVHVVQTADGRRVHELIPRVNGGTAGGDLAWLPDASGFFYTRYPRGEERPPEDRDFYQQVFFHQLGTPTSEDRHELKANLPRIAEIQLDADPRGRLIATVQDGDGGEFSHFLRTPDGRWRQFSEFGDRIVQAVFGPGDDLLLVSRNEAQRGKLLRLSAAELDSTKAVELVPEGKDTIVSSFWGSQSVLVAGSRIYVSYQLGGPSEIRVFDSEGVPQPAPRQLPVSSVGGLAATPSGDVLFRNESYTHPAGYYRHDAESGRTEPTSLKSGSPIDLSDVTVVRETAISKDGARVPLNILLPPGVERGGDHPCVVTGYGGYGISITPSFRPLNKLYMDHGVVYVVANLRGGGEFGEAWRRAGNLTKKQNVFDDFAAVLERLVARGDTSPKRLAIIGGSNGGLLMGATLTQHPDLIKAVVAKVGIYDMLRVELSPNGAFNIPEFGSVKNSEQFHALFGYSPYHKVRDGVAYPATLLTTGRNDPRVDPMQSRKMAARLQAATGGKTPILLRTNDKTGHGGDASLNERIEEETDVLAFLFDQLGIKSR